MAHDSHRTQLTDPATITTFALAGNARITLRSARTAEAMRIGAIELSMGEIRVLARESKILYAKS